MYNGKVLLGPLLEAMKAFGHFVRLSPGKEFVYLHGALHVESDGTTHIDQEYVNLVKDQAGRFLKMVKDHVPYYKEEVLEALMDMKS